MSNTTEVIYKDMLVKIQFYNKKSKYTYKKIMVTLTTITCNL